jgi:predicted MFS family arabinose efflux permease
VKTVPERTLLWLLAAVQLVNVLDFMMVMPLGPDFSRELGIPVSRLGLVGGSYVAAAAVAGLAGALFLDRFDRRPALAVAMFGLFAGTAAGGLARDLPSMMAARILAGAFGGPATSLALSIVADVVPAERRGRALGTVMGAFSVAAVLGVPLGLELAHRGTWRLPFFAVAGLGLAVGVAVFLLLPPLRGHLLAGVRARARLPRLRPVVLLSLSATASVMAASFALIPNLATWLQRNAGWPRERLGLLYMAGGAVTFFSVRVAGRLVDRFGSPRVAAGATALFLVVLGLAFLPETPLLPVVAVFVGFMLCNSTRNVSLSTLATRVPAPDERARFLSVQSAVQHLASAMGAMLSARLLSEDAAGRLVGIPRVAAFTMTMALALPFLLRQVEARVLSGERRAVPLPVTAPADP